MSKKNRQAAEQVARLREKLTRQEADHRRQLNAKNKAIEALKGERAAELASLAATFRHLLPLVEQLHLVASLADPGRSSTWDPTNSPTTRDEDPHLSSDGVSTRKGRDTTVDRERVEWADQEIGKLVDRIRRHMAPRSEQPAGKTEGPQCWYPDCDSRAVPQAMDATECRTCGRTFGRYVPIDFGTAPKRRCWLRGTDHRGESFTGESCPKCRGTREGDR